MAGISLRKLFQQKSGHHGHKGRPGQRGGSLPGRGGGSSMRTEPKLRSDRGYKERDTSIEDAMKGFEEDEELSDVIDMVGGHLDFRQLGERGMFPVDPKGYRLVVGDEIDYYNEDGDKKYGKIMNISGDKIKIAPVTEEGYFDKKNPIQQKLVNHKTGKPFYAH